MKKLVFSLLLAYALALLSAAGAQPLATLAPKDTVLSLGMTWQGGVLETLDDDLNALEWAKGKETIRKLFKAGASLDSDLQEMLELYEGMMDGFDSPGVLSEDVLGACPGLQAVADAAQDYRDKGYKTDALLTLSLGPFSPIPAGTALLRVDENLAPLYQQLQSTLLGCASAADVTVTELEQDGVTLYVVGDAGDFPVVAGNVDTLYFLGTNPETIRGVVRKVQGAAEPSFADTPFYQQASAQLGENVNGLGFSLNLAALADPLQSAAGLMGGDLGTAYLVRRADAVLRTLGGWAGTLSLTDEGVRRENVLAVNPEGGDEALLGLLLCQSCTVSAPFLAPEDSVGVSAQYLPWRELYAYAQDWASGLEAVTGTPLDLKQFVQDTFGLDLDTALFDWLGSEVQTYTLETLSPDLRTLVYNPAQVSIVPVSSPAAAAAGLEALGRTFGPILNDLLSSAGGMGAMGGAEDLFGAANLLGETVVSSYVYKDTTITRLRAGFNTDVGYTFVGNYLAVGSPRAVEAVIDAFQGARAFSFDPAYPSMRADLPATLSSFSYSDTAASLNGLADLLDVFSQPAAFAASTGLKAAVTEADNTSGGDLGYADLYEVTPEPLSVPGTVQGTLSEADENSYGTFVAYYELSGLTPGTQVSVSLSSDAFDTHLSLIDADDEVYLDENDDGENSVDAELEFTAEAGRRYLLEVTSYGGLETGDYRLSVNVVQATNAPEEPAAEPLSEAEVPTYSDLLTLFDLLPQSLRVLADHTGTSEGFSEVDGNTVYTRSLTRVRW